MARITPSSLRSLIQTTIYTNSSEKISGYDVQYMLNALLDHTLSEAFSVDATNTTGNLNINWNAGRVAEITFDSSSYIYEFTFLNTPPDYWDLWLKLINPGSASALALMAGTDQIRLPSGFSSNWTNSGTDLLYIFASGSDYYGFTYLDF